MRKLSQEVSGCKGPSSISDEVSQGIGGVLHCEQSAGLPRDHKQVQNARQRGKAKSNIDEFASLLDLAKEEASGTQPSLRVVFFP